MNQDAPLYTSKRKLKNLWQEYRIFPDRLELNFHFGQVTLPFERVKTIEKRPPLVVLDLFRGKLKFRDLFRTLKLDFADLANHIAIEKRRGIVRQFRITPDDPDAFVAAYQRAIAAKRGKRVSV